MAEGDSRSAHHPRDLCGCNRLVPLFPFGAAAALYRAAESLRRMALSVLRPDTTCGHARECARSPAQLPHRAHESGVPLSLLEHELSRRASHVSDGAVSCVATFARRGE